MTGPNEAKLRLVDTLQPGTLDNAEEGWTKGEKGLRDVADSLASAKNELLAAWDGRPAEAASSAFDVLAKTVTDRAEQMKNAAQAVRDAKAALVRAGAASLPAVPSLPSAPKPGTDGKVSDTAKTDFKDGVAAHDKGIEAREVKAAEILDKLDSDLAAARSLLTTAAPYDPNSEQIVDRTLVESPRAPTGTNPGSNPGSHVSTGSASGSAAVIGGTVGGTNSATADGELIGTVGAGAVGVGLGAGAKTPDSGSGGSQLGGAIGGGAVAGGGIGAALGGLRNVLGGKTVMPGGVPSTAGSAIGGNAARAGSPVLGGQNGQAGAGARSTGAPGTSSTGRGAGATGGRGATGASGTTGGRGGAGAGAGGRGGARGAAGAAGQRDKNDDQTLDHIRFEDDWIEDEDIAPGVIE
jgi:hypothetical protein